MTKHKNNSDILKKKLLLTLNSNHGMISMACQTCDCARSTYYKYYSEDENFKDEVDALQQRVGEMVKSQLMDNILEGDTASIIFYCKTKLKDDGFVERQEIKQDNTYSEGHPLENLLSEIDGMTKKVKENE